MVQQTKYKFEFAAVADDVMLFCLFTYDTAPSPVTSWQVLRQIRLCYGGAGVGVDFAVFKHSGI